MGFEQADAARVMFPPLPVLDISGGPDASAVQTIPTVITDHAAGARSNLYAADDMERATYIAKSYGRFLCRLFPNVKDIWVLVEGDVTATKYHEQQQRRSRINKNIPLHLPLGEILPPAEVETFAYALADARDVPVGDLTLGDVVDGFIDHRGEAPTSSARWLNQLRAAIAIRQVGTNAADVLVASGLSESEYADVAARRDKRLRDILLPPPLRPVADAMAAEQGGDIRDLVLRDVVRRYVQKGYEVVRAEAAAFVDPAWGAVLVAECIPQLEKVALQSILDLDGGVSGRIASIMVDGVETLPSEGERRALPFARHLGRPCIFYGNDSDIFLISLLQIPKYPSHPRVYYYDIARSRGGKTHVIDLVACVRRVPDPENAALALLLGGNDYVPPPDRANMTLCKLAGPPPGGGKRARDDAMLPAFSAVAAVSHDPSLLTDLVATRFPARAAYDRRVVEMLVKRAYVARMYYASESAATDPGEDVWLAHGWRTMTEPWTVQNIVHYSE